MTEREMKTVDIRPAEGWRIARITHDGCQYEAMPGWIIQEEVTYDGASGETTGTTGFRHVIPAALVGTQLEPADGLSTFWQIVGPSEPDPDDDDIIIETSRRYGDGTLKRLPSRVPCPHCKQDSHYASKLDRYVHLDGSDNARCWLAISRGETPLQP